MAKKKRRGGLWLGLTVLAVLGAGAWAWSQGMFEGERATTTQGAKVELGDLDIRVVEKGNLKAKNAVSLRCELEGRTTVLSLVPEGTHVVPGQLVAELDASGLIDKRQSQEISVQSAEATFTKARESYEIQRLQNESDIAAARQALEFAQSDLRKYIERDSPHTLQMSEKSIVLSEEELSRADERYNWSQQLAEKGFLTRTELEGDRLSFERNRILLEQAKRARQLLIEFDHPKQLRKLEADVEEAQRELQRVERQAASRLVDFESDKRSAEAKLKLEREVLAKMNDQIDKAILRAPVEGMVVYGREEGGRFRGGDPISEGAEVRERQELISIPTTGGMVAEASVHESVLKQVEVGQRCEIRVDAIPGRVFNGTLSFLALLPDQNSWWANPDLRVYRCEVQIQDASPEMRPGMSSSVTILVDYVDDALLIPLQSVFPTPDGPVVFVAPEDGGPPVKRSVVVGRDNDRRIEVLEGLALGETVLLSPPDGFAPKASTSRSREARAGAQDSEGGALPGAQPSAEDGPSGGRRSASGAGGAPAGQGARGGRGERPPGGAARPGDGAQGSGAQGSAVPSNGAPGKEVSAVESAVGSAAEGAAEPAHPPAKSSELPRR